MGNGYRCRAQVACKDNPQFLTFKFLRDVPGLVKVRVLLHHHVQKMEERRDALAPKLYPED